MLMLCLKCFWLGPIPFITFQTHNRVHKSPNDLPVDQPLHWKPLQGDIVALEAGSGARGQANSTSLTCSDLSVHFLTLEKSDSARAILSYGETV